MTATATITGNITRDIELKSTSAGRMVASFSVAVSKRVQKDGQWVDGLTSYFDVTAWGTLAENVAASTGKGVKVTVVGRLEQQSWDGPDGSKKSKVVLVADDVAVSLARVTVDVHRVARDLTAAPAVVEDEEPF
jgi:single-strand DNA-binding protein